MAWLVPEVLCYICGLAYIRSWNTDFKDAITTPPEIPNLKKRYGNSLMLYLRGDTHITVTARLLICFTPTTTKLYVPINLSSLFAGPLFDLELACVNTFRWCSMHVVNLGIGLWVSGSCLKLLLLDFPGVFGEGDDNSRLRTAHQLFKGWTHARRIPPAGLFGMFVSAVHPGVQVPIAWPDT